MLNTEQHAAAQHLWQLWQTGNRRVALSGAAAPTTLAAGYAMQAELERCSGESVLGWKIAATSAAGQAHIAVDGPIAGRLLASKFHHHPARVNYDGCSMQVAEAEFAFRFGAAIEPRQQAYRRDQVMDCVAALHPAIELPDSRFNDFTAVGGAQLAADNACANQFVLGAEADAGWRELDLAVHPIVLQVNDAVVSRGVGGDALGDPRDALTWLVNWASAQGISLAPGQVVTTGVCGQPSPVAPGDRIRAEFGELGSVEAVLFSGANNT